MNERAIAFTREMLAQHSQDYAALRQEMSDIQAGPGDMLIEDLDARHRDREQARNEKQNIQQRTVELARQREARIRIQAARVEAESQAESLRNLGLIAAFSQRCLPRLDQEHSDSPDHRRQTRTFTFGKLPRARTEAAALLRSVFWASATFDKTGKKLDYDTTQRHDYSFPREVLVRKSIVYPSYPFFFIGFDLSRRFSGSAITVPALSSKGESPNAHRDKGSEVDGFQKPLYLFNFAASKSRIARVKKELYDFAPSTDLSVRELKELYSPDRGMVTIGDRSFGSLSQYGHGMSTMLLPSNPQAIELGGFSDAAMDRYDVLPIMSMLAVRFGTTYELDDLLARRLKELTMDPMFGGKIPR